MGYSASTRPTIFRSIEEKMGYTLHIIGIIWTGVWIYISYTRRKTLGEVLVEKCDGVTSDSNPLGFKYYMILHVSWCVGLTLDLIRQLFH